MTGTWQKINGYCHLCHSWRFLDGGRISAMDTFIVIIVATAVVLVLAELLREVFADRPVHQPRSHFEDPTFRSPGAWS